MRNQEYLKTLVQKGKRAVRRLACIWLAGAMVVGATGIAQAASLADIFDAQQYADDYADLKDAFGYDEEALLDHYLTYGISEGRELSGGLLDVVKYREAYPDLDAAFGDDWDAYVDHYLIYGIYEGRDNFTGFDALDYAERYADLKEAFGDDALELFQHYMTYGKEEGRYAGEIVVPSVPASTGGQNSSSSGSGNTGGNTGDGNVGQDDWTTYPAGSETRTESYADGSWSMYVYSWRNQWFLRLDYSSDGSFLGGVRRYYHYINDEIDSMEEYERNSAGYTLSITFYLGGDNIENKVIYNKLDGSGTDLWDSKWIYSEQYNNGSVVGRTEYNSDGTIYDEGFGFDEEGTLIRLIQRKYDSVGNLIWSKDVQYGYDSKTGAKTSILEQWFDSEGNVTNQNYEEEDGNTVANYM